MDNNGGNDINSVVRRADNVLQSQDFLPRTAITGGYIFMCTDISMTEFTRRQVFGMPELYIDSVGTIRPGTPLFLYNCEAHMLYGIYEATSVGGVNIDPTVWPDARNPGRSQFPAQVRVRRRLICRTVSQVALMRYVHHLGGLRIRCELTVPEATCIIDLFRLLAYNQ